MFAKATKNFLKEVDDGGNLIAVSSLNDSDKLQLLSLVVKKNRFWCWQRPKYQLLSVSLGDVLTEGQFLSPVVVESDFVKYEGKFENHVSGSIETALGKVTLNAGSKGLVETQSSFGTLRKQEVDLQQLLRDAVERTINLKSPLLQQVLERRNEVLCVLTEKIVTTQKCVVSEHIQVQEKCGGMVGIRTKTVQVSAMEDGTTTKDTNVVLEIPASTTIAYSVLELYVKLDGQFVTLPLERAFHPFGRLPEQEQTALSGVLQVVLFDEELLVVLEQVCDDMVSGLPPPLAVLGELKPLQRQNLTAFLQLVGCSMQGECPGPQGVVSNQKLFATAYFLVSALAEMPDNAAALLGTCCKLQIIPTLCHLLHALSTGGDPDLGDTALAPLRDTEQFGIVQRLLATANVTLERRQSSVKAVTCQVPNISPLILYISLSGLHALGRARQ
ncbi:gasdermin-E isoform X2 [Artibeus jamaicensis]|uniref:gasdermin-E isoform X2 n=1 Tax=Artibeus jamaicensis TaxID=9417 RepID=UPI00235A5580|nr:gasdermin-E isoform X2 [Artibeus jamaicensis]